MIEKTSIQDIESGKYYLAKNCASAFIAVRSGDIMDSLSPDSPILKVYWSDDPNHKVGTVYANFFGTETFRGPMTKERVDLFTEAVSITL